MSLDHITKLKNPHWAAHEARHHPLVKKICRENDLKELEKTHLEVTTDNRSLLLESVMWR